MNENNVLYKNRGNGNHWINIRCVGTHSNASAIGTRLKIKAAIRGVSVWQMREVTSSSGYCSQNSLSAHFGLGDAARVDSLVILWPSGAETVETDLVVDQHYTVIEPHGSAVKGCRQDASGASLQILGNHPNPFSAKTTILFSLVQPGKVSLTVYNTLGRPVAELLDEVYYEAGAHEVVLNAEEMPAGIYFTLLLAEGQTTSWKIAVMR
jgi:hypothetical protein